ncbi:MAG: single-stranded DNA-binding protein [Actinobacteria bacterium]|nr:single-stranded DNA-binding protein [Actinomycetota bacterium]
MSDLKMPDINNVLIAGNLTNDPTFRKTSNGTSVANFYIASNRKYRDNSGIWRETVCYVGVVAWHKVAEACHEILKRGSSVLVDGELQSRNWKNEDGTSRNVVEIRARRIQFLNKKSSKDLEEIYAASLENSLTTSTEPESADQPNKVAADESDEIKVEPTDFDFGYQDLKL